jgi:hypothetical protein
MSYSGQSEPHAQARGGLRSGTTFAQIPTRLRLGARINEAPQRTMVHAPSIGAA